VFDIDLLARRLLHATSWVRSDVDPNEPIGYFGASTGAAAALRAAASMRHQVSAVVSRGGRPDLAGGSLIAVQAPTLLVVGELDTDVLVLNRRAFEVMRCPRRLALVPGASHLFEEPGTLAAAADLARDWFLDHLTVGHASASAAS
jgi:putative phosphoribosyl transferase